MNPATSDSRRARRPMVPDIPPSELLSCIASLTNGGYSVQLHGDGSGLSTFQNAAVTRSAADPNGDPGGFYIYLNDVDEGRVWSAGYRPMRIAAADYEFNRRGDLVEIVRIDDGIECRMAICVSPEYDFEVRLLRLMNRGTKRRRLQVTSYLEWVLGNPNFDASHPTFSKLFVETDYCRERNVVFAQRRPRSSDDAPLWGFHAVAFEAGMFAHGEVSFETNRARFIGRGRTLERPRALEVGERLTGDCGSVLDPIGSLRCIAELEPDQSQEAAFVLGAAATRLEIDRMLNAVRNFDEMRKLIAAASTAEPAASKAWSAAPGSNGDRILIHPPHRSRPQSPVAEATNKWFTPEIQGNGEMRDRFARPEESLEFDNGYGGFSRDGREYVIRISSEERGGQRRPPMPWVNVVANEKAGFIITEGGAGYTWSGNSRLNRLTIWHNDPITDPHSEALWIRDENAGDFWSPLPGPTPASNEYIVRHGFGYTTFEHVSHGLLQETTVFMAPDSPVKLTRCRITNRTGETRNLSLYQYLGLALGGLASETAGQITTSYDADQRVIWSTNPNREYYGHCAAFSAVRFEDLADERDVSFTCDPQSFFGDAVFVGPPKSLVNGEKLDGRDGQLDQACAAWNLKITLPPEATFECTYLLGEADNRESALDLIRGHSDPRQVQLALDTVTANWKDILSAIEVETPEREIDLMVNGWLLYQNLSCRMWGRSAYYQPGGAFGFRDQLQDSAAFLLHRPSITRTQILRHAAQQFIEGDVLHWWHPDTGYGVRTRFSDDLLWLPHFAAEYVEKTGDRSILDEELAFIESPTLADGQQEAYLRPEVSHERASVYEHCCRALDRGLTSGANGLPLIGCGDWNDGFSRVGRMGRGESVWLGFFIDCTLERMLPICSERGDRRRVEHYSSFREKLRAAIESAGWDGAWYRRAYYDNGQPIGSASSDECQIDALAQAWAVLSGVAPPERARMAMDAAEARLVDDNAGMIRLLTPAFNSTPNDPGYIKGYLPGIRENGGQYTHGVMWLVRAMAEMGRGSRAVELLKMLTPVWHTSTKSKVDVYQTEPYVVAADVYGEPPHVGRGGWTWYTGSASWMYRVAVESIFGFTTEHGQTLVINPSISSSWPRCRLSYRVPDSTTRYEIVIENPSGKERGVTQAMLDGQPALVENGAARVPLLRDGCSHRVDVRL